MKRSLKCSKCRLEYARWEKGDALPEFYPFCSDRCKWGDLHDWIVGDSEIEKEKDKPEHEEG